MRSFQTFIEQKQIEADNEKISLIGEAMVCSGIDFQTFWENVAFPIILGGQYDSVDSLTESILLKFVEDAGQPGLFSRIVDYFRGTPKSSSSPSSFDPGAMRPRADRQPDSWSGMQSAHRQGQRDAVTGQAQQATMAQVGVQAQDMIKARDEYKNAVQFIQSRVVQAARNLFDKTSQNPVFVGKPEAMHVLQDFSAKLTNFMTSWQPPQLNVSKYDKGVASVKPDFSGMKRSEHDYAMDYLNRKQQGNMERGAEAKNRAAFQQNAPSSAFSFDPSKIAAGRTPTVSP
jgi:hypothetical protein